MFTINRQITSTTKVSANLKIAAVAAPAQTLRTSAPITATPITGELNPPQGFTGPSPNLPEANTPGYVPTTSADRQAAVDDKLGLVDKTAAIDALLGRGGDQGNGGGHPLTDLMGSDRNGTPGVDQGFGTSPDGAALAAMFGGGSIGNIAQAGEVAGRSEVAIFSGAAQGSNSATRAQKGGSSVMNPMAPFQGGSVGGPLGAAAQSDVKTLSDFNKTGMIAGDAIDALLAIGAFAAAAAAKTPTGALALAAAVAIKATYDAASASAYSNADSFYNALESSEDPTNPANQAHLDLEKAKAEANKQGGGGASMPDPENSGVKVNVTTQTLLNQRLAAKAGKPTSQGGNGDATPVDDGGLGGVVRDGSIAVNQSSINGRNLFGQPGGAGGENVSGGNKGLNGFTNPNGAGVIDPGPDGGSPQGDARFAEDPGQATGGRQTSPNLGGGRDSGRQSSSTTSNTSTTLAAGARNLTLTGTAAINGTGNALDNLINGNEAANQLRGGAGDDTLNGRGGNDLLDGGRGRDVLTGGTGADRFRFSSSNSFGSNKADRITDFSSSEGDRIEISRSAFGIDAGAQVSFQTVSSRVELIRALESSTLLIQDTRDGSLLFNQNGAAAGAGQGGIFALVSNGASLQASNFTLLA